MNIDGTLRTVVYGYPCTINIDPIEKKPLFHFLPASPILSLATVGCNLHCKNCQNWEISQANPETTAAFACPPEKVVALARQNGCPCIAYTYTEPIVYYEYTHDTSRLAREAGLRNVLVTAGYVNEEPWRRLLADIDAITLDVKGFTEEFYRDVCSASLKPVLDALIVAKSLGVWVEVSHLIIPTLNDKPEELRGLCKWIGANLGAETPLHFLGFYPRYKMQHLPPTSAATLDMARQIALGEGLSYVYVGNVLSREGQNTYCAGCRKLLIERRGFAIVQNHVRDGRCPQCSRAVHGVWK